MPRRREAILTGRGVGKREHSFSTAAEVDLILHLLGTASGWGGLPEHEATHLSIDEDLPILEYAVRLKDVPVDAFWSVSLYNAAGYFEENTLGVNSINSLTTIREADGAITIRFGMHVDGAPHALPIMPRWNDVLRLYRPRTSALEGTWVAPRPEALAAR